MSTALDPMVMAILNSEDGMGRRKGTQRPSVLRTDQTLDGQPRSRKAARPQWYFRPRVDRIDTDGVIQVEKPVYLGYVDEIGKREAERLRDAMLPTINNRPAIVESQVPMEKILVQYETVYMPTLKPNTQETYGSVIRTRIRPRFGKLQVGQVRKMDVQAWINEMTAEPLGLSARRVAVAVLASIFDEAADWGFVQTRNPCDRVRFPDGVESERDLRALTPDECRRLIAHADMHSAALGQMVRVALFCGLRAGEMLALTWASYRPPVLFVTASRSQTAGIITRPKSLKGKRELPLGPVVLEKPEGAAQKDRIFPFPYQTVKFWLLRAAKAAGIQHGDGWGWHSLRRTHMTLMDKVGAKNMREQMGHATEDMSSLYLRKTFEDHSEKVQAMAALLIGETVGGKAN